MKLHNLITRTVIVWLMLIHNNLYSQDIEYKGAFFSGPIFTVNSRNDTLFIGAGSALEIYKLNTLYNLTYIGKSHTVDVVSSIFPYRNVVYTGNNGIGVSIFEISQPSTPSMYSILFDSLVSGHHLPIIDDQKAFFSIGSYGIIVMDVSNPIHPVEICRWKTPDFILSIGKKANTIFAADRTKGVILLNFDDNNLVPYDTLNPFPGCFWYSFYIDQQSEIMWLYAYGSSIPFNNNVYVALVSLNLSNYLQVLNTFYFPSRPIASMVVANNRAYMACWEQGLRIFDVSNIYTPSQIDTIPTNSYSLWTHLVNDSILCIAQYSEGLWLLNIKDSSYQIVKILDNYGDINSIAISDSVIYTIKSSEGVFALKYIGNDSFKEDSLFFIDLFKAKDIAIRDKYLYVASDEDGIYVYDVSLAVPIQVKHLSVNGALSLFVKDTLLICAQSQYWFTQRPVQISIWNIKNPSNPQFISDLQLTIQNWPQDRPLMFMDCMDTLLIVSCWNDALSGSVHMVSISNPQNMRIISQLSNTNIAQIQFLKKNDKIYVFAAMGTSVLGAANGMRVFLFQNNELVHLKDYITGYSGNRTVSIACVGDYCFLAEGGLSSHGYIYVIKLDDQMNCSLQQKIKIGSNTNHHILRLWKNYLVHAAGSPGLMIFRLNENLSIQEKFLCNDNKILLFPNPAKDFICFNIDWHSVTIIDSKGSILKFNENTNNSECLDISFLKPGHYYVIIDNIFTFSFIKI